MPTSTAKLGLDTLAMLRETAGEFRTVDEAIWQLAERARQFFDAQARSKPDHPGARSPEKYGIPRDREVYRKSVAADRKAK